MAARKRRDELVKVTIRLYRADVEKAKARAEADGESYQTIIRNKLRVAMRDDGGVVR